MNNYDQIISDFHEQQQWLFSLVRSRKPARSKDRTPENRLQYYEKRTGRISGFLRFAGHPERQYKSVHIAGTSGKGSVTTMIATILTACDLRTGHTISPYLQLPTEKLICDGYLIPPSEFAQLMRDFRALYDAWKKEGGPNLRYGDAWTLLKYLWLAKREVDWGVIETAVGGRYDRTNVLPSDLAVITNVDYDHVKSLGPNLTDIAWHKAGIIKEGKIAITAASKPSVLDVIRTEAAQKGARLYERGADFDYVAHDPSTISVQTPFARYDHIYVGANGTYQLENAALAIAAVDLLAQHHPIPLTQERVASALAGVTYPGRMEIVSKTPLVILDGAHNPAKMRALVQSVQTSYPNKRITTIFGALGYKDVSKIVEILRPISARFIATEPHLLGKRATPSHLLAEMIQQLCPTTPVTFAEQVNDAIEQALAHSRPDELLLITGSLYLVGEARGYWYPTQQLLAQSEQAPGLLWGH
ncbi:MAG: bifunctional folylpolyglutamate synthase/dihydrofolate synthase [Ardenticatenaceae bacterium]